jgi:hypothetical protein
MVVVFGGGAVGSTHQAITTDYYGERAGARLHIDFVPPGALDVEPGSTAVALRARVSPHPILNTGTLSFELQRGSEVRAELFDVRGRRVRVLVDSPRLDPGPHRVPIGEGMTPGVYFYRVRAGGEAVTGRCLLLK